jgi:hypothetical protein
MASATDTARLFGCFFIDHSSSSSLTPDHGIAAVALLDRLPARSLHSGRASDKSDKLVAFTFDLLESDPPPLVLFLRSDLL